MIRLLALFFARQILANEITDPTDENPVLVGPEAPEEETNPLTEEIFSSWALFIVLLLVVSALWSSYYLQQRRVKSIHETVLSIFYGMFVGLILRVTPGHYIQDAVKFNSGYFFNFLLPPIILNSGYELHQANFFRNIGSILTFAIPGTFISAIVLGVILFIWTKLGLDGIDVSLVDALSVGATLSATDPVTILSIFNSYKVDPKLYTIIFGESLLNDAICIVMFETCQKFHGQAVSVSSVLKGIGLFLMTFTVSLLIGVVVGVFIALVLKHSLIRRYPQIETCLVLLFAYESYFFSNGCHMSGIVSLLFCGITMKHYAYFNMSRRTQIATKYIFQLLAQLSENFIFIYLGLSLFTEVELVFRPMLIIVTTISICISRWCAVFPLSRLINWTTRAKHKGGSSAINYTQDEIPPNYQMMIFWAGLRGAVGVALAMGLQGEAKSSLLATVLVVVVLTVILFGGTTAGMLETLNIRVGVIDEQESDDEFDIEAPKPMQLNQIIPGATTPVYSIYSDAAGSRSRTGSQQSFYNNEDEDAADAPPDMNDDEMTSDLDDIPPMANQAQSSKINLQSMSFNNLLSMDDHAKWFTHFDEQVLKPVLLDNLTENNNSKDKIED
ncbi:Na+/H+ and K+/H+ exchanger [Komagataella phaffii CBS 7435]|uniref:Sodium/hydrogen exchanger n=2 Tax=Komagataella phaffii TaxID=460519 RepID=C4QZT8_KOMPG|nr:Endosomal Na+/H+ exchanger, required for intracellular sequestration of Na+ [Komagataella phaffii GS115]AOA62914.1 GQ67_00181T0 [Komagataella phaffii]CAH2448740.1 Na+/H+ and K+/H+ exchanger [Komagataella phaffii CBS 7435]AOA68037.1 GQ68_01207T0 [Komagataella phaffii GS115]CAY68762.1 Endosomal Na+/H+ exchanger, required for intracellular sequestration of Na+ [Komagataella phaffii GS115]CCA38831.1 Na+/H+ and K+/H+ exchanger [Komagataella phaffii CBS 7435]